MPEEAQNTEDVIFEAAVRVFVAKGYYGARMQEIADEADINKSMLHYYFRSKDQLFQKVYQREISRFFPIILDVLGSDLPLDEKVEKLITTYYTLLKENPNLIQFILHEMNQHPERLKKFMEEKCLQPPNNFTELIKKEIDQGAMDPIDSKQLLVNIVSLTVFPFIARSMVQAICRLDEERYFKFMEERKSFLVEFILNAVNYKR